MFRVGIVALLTSFNIYIYVFDDKGIDDILAAADVSVNFPDILVLAKLTTFSSNIFCFSIITQ